MKTWRKISKFKLFTAMGLGIGLAGTLPSAWARQDLVPGSRFTSAKAAAMGDAFLPMADDGPTGLFYNPAGIGKVREKQIEPLTLGGYLNDPYVNLIGTMPLNFYNVGSLDAYKSTLQANPTKYAGVGMSAMSSFYMPYLAISVLAETQAGARYDAAGTITYRAQQEIIPAIGTGIRLADGAFHLGYSLQWVNRVEASGTVPYASATTYDLSARRGSGLSHNAGIGITLPVAALPSFNFVARNILGTSFTDFSLVPYGIPSSGLPTTQPMSLDASVSVHPKFGRGMSLNLVAQYRDLTSNQIPIWGLLAIGAEFNFRDTFFLRGGYGSGYPSAGGGFRRKNAEVSFAWYSEELSTVFRGQQDVHYLLQLCVRIF